jgi:hypothetical protein
MLASNTEKVRVGARGGGGSCGGGD